MTRSLVLPVLFGLPLSLASLTGCASPDVRGAEAPVVYGDDDREDVYAHPSSDLRELAHDSIVALMRDTRLDEQLDGSFELTPTLTLGESYDLCSDQRFIDQPTSAYCSGTLVAPDIVVTAGHCIETLSECLNTRFVFDYLYTAEGVLAPLEADDVYSCVEILSRQDGVLDYAYLRLSRDVVGHTPVPLAPGVTTTCRNVEDEMEVTVLGFGSGVPLKIDSGGEVTNPSSRGTNFFLTSLDTFAGNSGSGVFDDAGRLVGVLSGGLADYRTRTEEGCDEVNTLAEQFGGEQVGHLLPTLVRYCDEATDPESSLCAHADTHCPDGSNPDMGVMPDSGMDPDQSVVDDSGVAADMGPGRRNRGCSTTPGRASSASLLWLATALGLVWRRRNRRTSSTVG